MIMLSPAVMQLPRSAFVALVLFTCGACRSKPSSGNVSQPEAAPSAATVAPSSAAAPVTSGNAEHEHAGHDHGHDDGHDHGDDDSLHARLHRPPDPNAPPLAIPMGHTKVEAKPVAEVSVSPDDPLRGKFTLADATKGLPAKGQLVAELRTELGTLKCELYDDRAPITVANFVGLARGRRPFKDANGKWVKKPAYDGTTFHRIQRGLVLEAGDPTGSGEGTPGYVIPDEIWEDAYHTGRGLLCMASREPNRNGMRFFVLNGNAPQLDNTATIFGKCGPDDVIDRIALVDVAGERPLKPPKIHSVRVQRVPRRVEAPPSPFGAGKRAPCTLGQDQTCNDDPAVSALWGRCTELGVCECKPPFELAPWGRCRPPPQSR